MKKKLAIVITLVSVLALAIVLPVSAAKPVDEGGSYNGNGAPSGEHVTLNIIGVQNVKTQDMT